MDVIKTNSTDQFITPKLTLLDEALREVLTRSEMPTVTTYQLFIHIRALYKSGQKLWLRNLAPDKEKLNRVRRALVEANVLTPDKDFRHGVYRIVENGDRPAEEICGMVEPFWSQKRGQTFKIE